MAGHTAAPRMGAESRSIPSRSDQPRATRPARSPLGCKSSTETVSPRHWLISPSYPMALAWEKAEEHNLALPCSLPAPCPGAASGTTGVERVSSHPRSPISGYSQSSESCTGGCSNSPRGDKQWVSQETFTPSDSFVAFHSWGNRGTAIQQDSLPSHPPLPFPRQLVRTLLYRTTPPDLSYWRVREEGESPHTQNPSILDFHKGCRLLLCDPKMAIWGLPLPHAQLTPCKAAPQGAGS